MSSSQTSPSAGSVDDLEPGRLEVVLDRAVVADDQDAIVEPGAALQHQRHVLDRLGRRRRRGQEAGRAVLRDPEAVGEAVAGGEGEHGNVGMLLAQLGEQVDGPATDMSSRTASGSSSAKDWLALEPRNEEAQAPPAGLAAQSLHHGRVLGDDEDARERDRPEVVPLVGGRGRRGGGSPSRPDGGADDLRLDCGDPVGELAGGGVGLQQCLAAARQLRHPREAERPAGANELMGGPAGLRAQPGSSWTRSSRAMRSSMTERFCSHTAATIACWEVSAAASI